MAFCIGTYVEPRSRDGVNWTLEETRAAFVLYMMLEPREITETTADIRQLALALGRSESSVCKKIYNIQANDANRTAGKGLSHSSKFDKIVWEMYAEQSDVFLDESIALLSLASTTRSEASSRIDYGSEAFVEGSERVSQVRQRVNQGYFRNTLMKNYGRKCCLTGIAFDQLLVASHIKPWKDSSAKEKVAASNGLLLNAFHDRAFDKGLITLDDKYRIVLSSEAVRRSRKDNVARDWLVGFEGKRIFVPEVAPPEQSYIRWHNENVFVA